MTLTRSSLVYLSVSTLLLMSGCVGFINDDGDDEVGEADTTGDGDGDGDGDAAEYTIFEIQEGADNGTFADKTQVTLKGVVVTSPMSVEGSLVFVEEAEGGAWSGISLYLWEEAALGVTVQPGDVVDVVGEYTEFHDASQIVVKNPGDITVISSGAQPGPDVVPAAEVGQEQWEAVRVRVENAVIAQAKDDFGQYVIEGGIKVGYLFTDLPPAQVGGVFESITGPVAYSFDEFKIVPVTFDDLAGYQAGPDPTEDTSIFDLQQEVVLEDTYVKLEDVVVSTGVSYSGDVFFVQEPEGGAYSGIQVSLVDPAGLDVSPGDVVTVVGTYSEFYDMSQVRVASVEKVTVTSSGAAPVPELIADPATIATGGSMTENWEGVLVEVQNVTVTNDTLEYNEFEVTDGLHVDDLFFALDDWMIPGVGTGFASIVGPLYYNFETFKVGPRDAADLVAN
jgi:DNA/RNA endonuclease YhcR with UshA esterase domain